MKATAPSHPPNKGVRPQGYASGLSPICFQVEHPPEAKRWRHHAATSNASSEDKKYKNIHMRWKSAPNFWAECGQTFSPGGDCADNIATVGSNRSRSAIASLEPVRQPVLLWSKETTPQEEDISLSLKDRANSSPVRSKPWKPMAIKAAKRKFPVATALATKARAGTAVMGGAWGFQYVSIVWTCAKLGEASLSAQARRSANLTSSQRYMSGLHQRPIVLQFIQLQWRPGQRRLLLQVGKDTANSSLEADSSAFRTAICPGLTGWCNLWHGRDTKFWSVHWHDFTWLCRDSLTWGARVYPRLSHSCCGFFLLRTLCGGTWWCATTTWSLCFLGDELFAVLWTEHSPQIWWNGIGALWPFVRLHKTRAIPMSFPLESFWSQGTYLR